MLAGVRNSLADDLLMAEVHTVEETDGEADFLAAGGQFRCGVNQFHVDWLNRLNGLNKLNE